MCTFAIIREGFHRARMWSLALESFCMSCSVSNCMSFAWAGLTKKSSQLFLERLFQILHLSLHVSEENIKWVFVTGSCKENYATFTVSWNSSSTKQWFLIENICEMKLGLQRIHCHQCWYFTQSMLPVGWSWVAIMYEMLLHSVFLECFLKMSQLWQFLMFGSSDDLSIRNLMCFTA